MSKYNIPMSNLTLRFQKEQRVFKQLTHKDALIDALISLYNNTVNQHSSQQEPANKFIELYKPVYHEINKTKLSLKDFQVLHENSFAEGAFGKVTIVKSTRNNQIYAMKTSSKAKLINQLDRSSPMEERLILSNENEEWLPGLYASFQDEKNLYLVMEYAPGGDLQGLLERRSFQPFNEQEARFYCTELILAVERVHQLGYMHRDIKPGNILIDSKGHIKLGDLGSCISLDTKDHLLMVGTMPYVSPEMCNSEGFDARHGGVAYGAEVDWWSVGIVLYELLYGERPFTGSDVKIQMSLLNPKVSVQFDANMKVSDEAKDLLSRLLCKTRDKRLANVTEIKSHAFFKDVNWSALRTSAVPPFIPSIVSPDDVTFFSATSNENESDDQDDQEDSFVVDQEKDQQNSFDKEYPFIGYSYNNIASNVEKPAKTSSNQEFIAQLRQKRGSLEAKQWEEEKSKLKLELEQLKSQQSSQMTLQIEETKTLQQKLAELEDKDMQSQHLIQSLREENDRLKGSSNDMDKLVEENDRLKVSVVALQHQLSDMEAENVKLTDTITSQKDTVTEIQTDNSKLQTTLEELRLENEQRSREIKGSAQLRENISQQQDRVTVLEKDILLINATCDEYRKQISEYQSNMENSRKSDSDRQKLLQSLQQQIKDLESQLQDAKEHSQSIEKNYNQKLSQQATDYDNSIQQIKVECQQLKQELKRRQSKETAGDRTMKRSIKSLPVIPVASAASPLDSPGVGRSILSTMWQRERDSLRNAQQALEDSESQLAYAKKQVIRLKREIKCYQKYTFQQQQQQQQNGLSLVDQKDRNGDADVSMLKNHPDSGSQRHTARKQPLSKNTANNLMASVYSEKSVDVPILGLKNAMKQDSSLDIVHNKKNQALLDKIEQERNFIKSTERTIAARARLVRNKGAIDKELVISLQHAQSTLASLESSLSIKKYSPSDFFQSKKPFASTFDDLTDI